MDTKDFTRERKLPFWRVIVITLSGWKRSLQSRINKFFKEIGALEEIPTSSAFCQAREKINPDIYKNLNNETVKFFYENYEEKNLVKKWKGYLVWAVDCSRANLPNTKEAREKYSIQRNQNNKEGVCQGLVSCLYDVLNEIAINTSIDKKKSEKLFVLEEHKDYFRNDILVLYDRAYGDYSVIAYHIKEKVDFVIRGKEKCTFKEVEKFLESGGIDGIVRISVTKKQRKIVEKLRLPKSVKIRVVKIILDNGETEILLTSLQDKCYKRRDFKEVYNKRWGVEVYFDRLKNQLSLELFSSGKINNIKQDFYSTVFLSTLESVLIKEDEEEIIKNCKEKKLQYEYKINKSVSYNAILDDVVDVFLDDNTSPTEVVYTLRSLFKKGKTAIRPGRKYERKKIRDGKRFRFHKYTKTIIA